MALNLFPLLCYRPSSSRCDFPEVNLASNTHKNLWPNMQKKICMHTETVFFEFISIQNMVSEVSDVSFAFFAIEIGPLHVGPRKRPKQLFFELSKKFDFFSDFTYSEQECELSMKLYRHNSNIH